MDDCRPKLLSVCRILDFIGAEVRFFNPEGLPVKDDVSEGHEKVALQLAIRRAIASLVQAQVS
jgi:hypothetical protein